jgi:hypothetical protein
MTIRSILLGEPPCPPPEEEPPFSAPFPRELSHIHGIDFRNAADRTELISCFIRLITTFKTQPAFATRVKLLEFILGAIVPSMFPIFLECGLADLLTCGCSSLDTEQPDYFSKSPQFDSLCFSFLSRNFRPFADRLTSPPIIAFQKLVSRLPFPKCRFLLQMVAKAEQFAFWVNAPSRTLPALRLILSCFRPPHAYEIPAPLASEISRCLVIAALLATAFADAALGPVVADLAVVVTHFLADYPLSFVNASTVACLQGIASERVVAVPLREARAHPRAVPLAALLQLVRFSVFASTAQSAADLAALASLCPAACAEVLRLRAPLLARDPALLAALAQGAPADAAAQFASFARFPERLPELAVLLRADLALPARLKLFSRRLGRILHAVFAAAGANRVASTDAEALIACARIMESLVGFAGAAPLRYHALPSVFPHLFAVALAVADALVASPLFPQAHRRAPLAFLVGAAFGDLAQACMRSFREFLPFLVQTDATPGRVLLMALALEGAAAGARRFFVANLPQLVAFGLAILKVPTEYTAEIAARFFIACVQACVTGQAGRETLYPLLQTPIWLVCRVAAVAANIEPIAQPATFLRFLGFIEKIVVDPYVRTFILTHADDAFWSALENAVSVALGFLHGRLPARVFRIVGRLCDFSCSLRPECPGGQRLVFDCPNHAVVAAFCQCLTRIPYCPLSPPEFGNLAMSAFEMLLAFCDPPPLAAFVAAQINPDTISQIVVMAAKSGTVFGEICRDLAGQITRSFERDAASQDPLEFASIQDRFAMEDRSQEILSGLYFSFLVSAERL